jgi:hypothetical protein
MKENNSPSTLLTKVLRADGVFALLSGAILLIGAGPVARLIGLEAPVALALTGVVLLGYAFGLLYWAAREHANRRVARVVIILNLLWVAVSYGGLLLGLFPLNSTGKWAVALVAEAVFIFAVVEYIALRRSSRAATAIEDDRRVPVEMEQFPS